MEYLDLSGYDYLKSPLPMQNIGWLGLVNGIQGADEPQVDTGFVAQLKKMSQRVSRIALGWHACEFCAANGKAIKGNGEFTYVLADGNTYAAPVMIVHYVEVHGYRPHPAFRDSLGAADRLPWDVRAELLSDLILDRSADIELRCEAICEISNWGDMRAMEALMEATRDEELEDLAAEEIGRSLGWVNVKSGGCLDHLPVGDLSHRVHWGIRDMLKPASRYLR